MRASCAHAKIRSLDAFAARAMPGVHAVLTADDLPARMACSQTRDRAGKVLCRRTCRDAPSGPGTARPNEVPANACGRFAERFRRRCFDPAPSTPGGAHAPIAGRSRRTLRGGAYPWGKRTRNVERKVEGKKQSHRSGLYYCNECQGQFTVTVGTVFERSKIPLTKWWHATFLMNSSKKGISAHQLHRMLGVTYKTAWFMAHRIREAMNGKGSAPIGGEGSFVE